MIAPWEVRQQITTRIAALTVAAAYQQNAADAWRETKNPLIPEFMPEPAAHLAFFVDNRDGQIAMTRQNTLEAVRFEAPVTVRFLSRLRPDARVSDWDMAQKALVALLQWLLVWQPDDFDLSISPGAYASRVVGADYVAVELRITAIYLTSSTP